MNLFKKIYNIYLEMIMPSINGIKTVYCYKKPSKDKNYYFNEIGFTPFIYNNFTIFHTGLNKNDLYHVPNRLKERYGDRYTLNDVFIVVKRGIDKYLQTKNKNKYNLQQSFHIISDSYPFHVVIQISQNYLEIEDRNILGINYKQSYFCFVYTILKPGMDPINQDDIKLTVTEEINNNNIQILNVK